MQHNQWQQWFIIVSIQRCRRTKWQFLFDQWCYWQRSPMDSCIQFGKKYFWTELNETFAYNIQFYFSYRNWWIRHVVLRIASNSIKNFNGLPYLSFYCCQLPSCTYWKLKFITIVPISAWNRHETPSNDTDTMNKRNNFLCCMKMLRNHLYHLIYLATKEIQKNPKFQFQYHILCCLSVSLISK